LDPQPVGFRSPRTAQVSCCFRCQRQESGRTSHARYRSVRDPLVLRVRVAGPVRLGQVPVLYPAQRRRPLLLCPLEPLAGPDPSKHRRDLARL